MPSAGFETAIPAIKRLQTYALEHTTIGISLLLHLRLQQATLRVYTT